MRSNPLLIISIFALILIAIDYIVYSGIKNLYPVIKKKKYLRYSYWSSPVLILLLLALIPVIQKILDPVFFFTYFHTISGLFFLIYIPKLIFIFFEILQWIFELAKRIFEKVVVHSRKKIDPEGIKISRSQFLRKAGIVTAAVPFASIAYGILWGRFNFTVRNLTLIYNNLPDSFDGFKLLQFSDFHAGSFINNKDKIKYAVELMNKQNADIILFTGDFVNNMADELSGFADILMDLQAPKGMYSILGNHDYGDYVEWNSIHEKNNNFKYLLDIQRECGFNLLLNNSVKIFNGLDFIEVIGVENWGLPPFPQYGNLEKALSETEEKSFKILLSHDPTHWDEQVLNFTDIDLTLSGHTHGAQFGIEIPGWRWSPVNMRYKRWGGLYDEGKQKLNVNTGLGFIGFPGRVGMPPEITIIELIKA